MNCKIINKAEEAMGLAVIIDVFRAFTLEPYVINNGASKLIPVGDIEIAKSFKEKDNKCILIGERNGIKLEGFDYGNSPSKIADVDFTGKTVVHTTSCGTQGIVRAVNAKEIITGSLVNAGAIVEYIKNKNIKDISLVALSRPGEDPFEEDLLCAEYLKAKLENKSTKLIEEQIKNLKNTRGKIFFDNNMQEHFPREDFELCIEFNKFDFILKANLKDDGIIEMKKIKMV